MRTISTELHVVGPRYRRIKVVARIETEPYASAATVQLAVKGAINAFLDPLGRPPRPFQASSPQPTKPAGLAANSGSTSHRPACSV